VRLKLSEMKSKKNNFFMLWLFAENDSNFRATKIRKLRQTIECIAMNYRE